MSRGGIIQLGVLEIRNWKWDMGNRKWDIGLGLLKMVHCLKSNNYECELMESDYLPYISFEKFRVGGGWCSEVITSALLLLFLN